MHLGRAQARPDIEGGDKLTERIIRLPEILARTSLGRSTIYAMMGRGEFPHPVRLGARSIGWPESQLAQWLAERLKADVN